MPARRAPRPWTEQAGERLGMVGGRVQAESRRVVERLRALRTHEGRRRNVAPLAVLMAAAGFVAGIAWGVWRRRHGRTR